MNLGRDWLTRKAQRRLLKTKNGPNKSKWRLWSNSRITRKEKKEKAEACEQKKWWAPPHCNLDSSLLLLVIALFNPRSLSLNSFTMLQVSFTFLNLFFQVHIQSSLFGARNFGFFIEIFNTQWDFTYFPRIYGIGCRVLSFYINHWLCA